MKQSSTWRQFKLLMWKSIMIRKRNWFFFFLELLLPISIFIIFALAVQHFNISPKATIEEAQIPPKIDLMELNSNFNLSTKLCYYPTVNFTTEIMKTVQSKLKLDAKSLCLFLVYIEMLTEGFHLDILNFMNESSFLDYFVEIQGNHSVFVVVFQNVQNFTVSRQMVYLIRPYFKDVKWNTALLIDDNFGEMYEPYLGSRNYIETGFLSLQIALETSFIEMVTQQSLLFNIVVQEFPYPEHTIDFKLVKIFDQAFPLLILVAFLITIFLALGKPTYEKGTGIKELIKTTGLNSWLIFLGWYFHHIIVNLVSILLCVIFLTVPIWNAEEAIVKHSSFSILVVFLFLFCCSAITFSLLIASRFDNEVAAQALGLGIWCTSIFLDTDRIESKNLQMLVSIFPSFCIRYICKQIGIYEFREIGAHWSNIYNTANDDAHAITISNGFSMLFASSIIFSTLSLYIEQLYPGRHGAAKPYYFIIYYKAFWRKIAQPSNVDTEISLVSENHHDTETPTENLKPRIRIIELCKAYGKIKAIDSLSMEVYEGLITVLLGQTGSGKTTTMSILTGMMKPTSGKAFIYDEDVRYNMNVIRCSLGYCPQNNVNFQDLNVFDHLVFFGMLKGHNKPRAISQATAVLKELNLQDQHEKQAAQLSDDMQRRLTLGIALMGNPKVLILDEPTTGLEPKIRRELWDILLRLKKSRTIVITTYDMEEADALADRIAIIDHGQLTCYGTSLFLKKLYGTGYHLTLIRDKDLFEIRNPGENQVDNVTEVVKENLNDATLFNSNLNCLTYLLPYDKKSEYSAVLSAIEDNKEILCITHIEMSIATLEEVFLKAGSFAEKCNTELKFKLKSAALQDTTKFKSLNLQLYALIQKRWLIFKKRYLTFLIPAILAMVLCVGAIHLTYVTNIKTTKEEVKLDFKLNNYGKTTVYYSSNSETDYFSKIKKKYGALVEAQSNDAYEVDNVDQEILYEGNENFDFYRNKLIVAAEFIDAEPSNFANAMFSNPAAHGSTISVNLLCNSILKTIKSDHYLIKSGISPLHEDQFHFHSSNESMFEMFAVLIYWMVMFPIGLMFLVIPFMVFPQIENSSNLKQLQLMCGVRPLHYWCMFYVMDLLFYFTWLLITLTIMAFYQSVGLPLFDNASHSLALMVILVAYGMPVIPFAYIFSHAKNVFNGIIWYFTIACILPVILFALIQGEIFPPWSNYLFVLYPQYGLFYLLITFCSNAIERNKWIMRSAQEKLQQCHYYPNPCCNNEESMECYGHFNFIQGQLNEPIKCILIIIASTFLYFAILLIMEEQFLQKFIERIRLVFYKHKKKSIEDYTNREDVKFQQVRVSEIMERELNQEDDIISAASSIPYISRIIELLQCRVSLVSENRENELLVHNLEKSFKGVKVVKKISFSVDMGECFGLLGVNGAGKTTTFRMLTGNLPVLTGECRILSLSGQRVYLTKTSKKYFSNIGYCPQHDIVEEVLTGREMLRLFGRLRGISRGLDKEIQILAKCLGFDDSLNRACGDYSGGTKRKLTIAMALIGVPPVILLDEPTTGVDAISRRAIWNTILLLKNQKFKPAIVLTTHSLEECKVLCNKVAIMKDGKFDCYGTIPQLKTKYAQGFTVTLKFLAVVNVEEQLQEIQNMKLKFEKMYYGTFQLKKEYASLIQYYIDDLNKKWSDIFQDIEKLREEFSIIEDYTITEVTLEDVFLKIARSE